MSLAQALDECGDRCPRTDSTAGLVEHGRPVVLGQQRYPRGDLVGVDGADGEIGELGQQLEPARHLRPQRDGTVAGDQLGAEVGLPGAPQSTALDGHGHQAWVVVGVPEQPRLTRRLPAAGRRGVVHGDRQALLHRLVRRRQPDDPGADDGDVCACGHGRVSSAPSVGPAWQIAGWSFMELSCTGCARAEFQSLRGTALR